jgi:hypothetical protein
MVDKFLKVPGSYQWAGISTLVSTLLMCVRERGAGGVLPSTRPPRQPLHSPHAQPPPRPPSQIALQHFCCLYSTLCHASAHHVEPKQHTRHDAAKDVIYKLYIFFSSPLK